MVLLLDSRVFMRLLLTWLVRFPLGLSVYLLLPAFAVSLLMFLLVLLLSLGLANQLFSHREEQIVKLPTLMFLLVLSQSSRLCSL